MPRSIEVLATAADLFHAAAEEFVSLGRTAIGAQGRFTVALSGGSTPKALYSLLAANYANFAWDRVFLFFGDERHVPPTDPESNYRMVNESLLTKITIPSANVFRVHGENPRRRCCGCGLRKKDPRILCPEAGRISAFRSDTARHGARPPYRFPLPRLQGTR